MVKTLHYLGPYKKQVTWGLIIKFIGSISELFLPLILDYLIDDVAAAYETNGSKSTVIQIVVFGIVMLVLSVVCITCNIVANRMSAVSSGKMTHDLRYDLFSKISRLQSGQVDEFTMPSLISRLTSDTYYVNKTVGETLRMGVRAPILLIGGLILCFVIDPFLALVFLVCLPIVTLGFVFITKSSIKLYNTVQRGGDNVVRSTQENITGVRVVKALSKSDYEADKFSRVNEDLMKNEYKANKITSVTNPFATLVLNLGLVGIIVVGALRNSSAGDLLAFLSLFTIIQTAMLNLSRIFVTISRGIASSARIEKVLDVDESQTIYEETDEETDETEKSEGTYVSDGSSVGEYVLPGKTDEVATGGTIVSDVFPASAEASFAGGEAGTPGKEVSAPTRVKMVCGKGDPSFKIEFRDVCFSYNGKEDNLTHISFSVRPGQTVGIIGGTGSGKTTLINLLMRFYDCGSGAVYIDGKDVRAYEPDELREKFGAAFQNDFLYSGTVRDNIKYFRDITEENVRKAAECAQADEFIDNLDGGMDFVIGQKAQNLSGGQKQRVLIARALASDPDILVLDDSSSALDYATDARLRRCLNRMYPGSTKFIVAQRVSAVKHADLIVVMDDGKMKGIGTHDELVVSCEDYREIYSAQMGEKVA